MTRVDDLSHMRAALALARRGLGACWPNPAVGCVLVQGGRVVGRAVTAPGGRPHAEAAALAMAGAQARGATAYVTLEPCCHHGHTPPCADALVAAGVVRVVVALRDRDARVDGGGIARLRDAGVRVEEGLLATDSLELCEGFFTRLALGRPLVTLKLASTLDGRIATSTGHSRWITGAEARMEAHKLRGRHDAVMVGVGTVLADDPDLTCRIAGFRARSPLRIVADSRLRTPPAARLIADGLPTWIATRPDSAGRDRFGHGAVEMLDVPASPSGIDLGALLATLGGRGLTRLLVEGGAGIAASLLVADLVDRIAWFHAPGAIGGDGRAAVDGMGVATLADLRRFVREDARPVGADMLTELKRAA